MSKSSDALVQDPNGGIPRLIEIMRRLRDPKTGCPWDIEQTFETIAPYTIEEAYEVADAIERKDIGDLRGELGDLLFQSIFHARMAEELGQFDIHDVANTMADKMVARHPHVFGSENRDKTAAEQSLDWEEAKAAERGTKAQTGALDGVAVALPALLRAVKLQKRAARVGFDWPRTEDVLDKISEEVGELHDAHKSGDRQNTLEEFGDLLFVMANLARHLDIDPEEALRAANAKFTRRFEAVEQELRKIGLSPRSSDLQEMDSLWNEVKAREKDASEPGGLTRQK